MYRPLPSRSSQVSRRVVSAPHLAHASPNQVAAQESDASGPDLVCTTPQGGPEVATSGEVSGVDSPSDAAVWVEREGV